VKIQTVAIQRILPRTLLLLTIASAALAPAAAAQDGPAWAVNAGIFNTIGDDTPFEAGVELRLRPRTKMNLVPAFGLAATEEGSFWVYGGLRFDWQAAEGWFISPQLAVTAYENGDDLNLGGVVEFRSGLEVAYRLPSGSRLGILFFHLSNARIYKVNPGSNSLVLTWTFAR